jgi:DNA-binding NtrC family response regulator
MKENCTCILIDDDADVHEFFGIIVRETALKLECIFTSSCQEAIATAENTLGKIFNYVILDWIMLDNIGLGCSRDLKQVPASGPSRFIIYSMMPPPKQVLQLYSLDDAIFLAKDGSFETATQKQKALFNAE